MRCEGFSVKKLYRADQPFNAKAAISGRMRQFQPGETFLCDPSQTGPIVVIEADEFLFLIERPTFEACCRFQGGFAA